MKPLLLLDFDGVIADSRELSKKCVSTLRGGSLSDEAFRRLFDGNAPEALFEDRPSKDLSNSKRARLFFAYYGRKIRHCSLHAGMHKLIEECAREYLLAVVSSTGGDLIRNYLKLYRLDRYIEVVMGLEVHHDKAVKFRQLLEMYDCPQHRALFVTDTLGDIREANEVGITSVGVTWGYQTREDLEKGQPLIVVDSARTLHREIVQYFNTHP